MKVVNKYWPRLVHIGLGDIGRLIGHVFESCNLQRAHEIKFYHVARLHIAPQMSSILFFLQRPCSPPGPTGALEIFVVARQGLDTRRSAAACIGSSLWVKSGLDAIFANAF